MVDGLCHVEGSLKHQTICGYHKCNSRKLCIEKKPNVIFINSDPFATLYFLLDTFSIEHFSFYITYSIVEWANFYFPSLTHKYINLEITLSKSANQKWENRKCFVKKKHGTRIIHFQCIQLKVEG